LWVEAEHYKVVGACLAAARRRANVTQQELAARLHKPQSFVSEYERGQRRVDVVELLVIYLVCSASIRSISSSKSRRQPGCDGHGWGSAISSDQSLSAFMGVQLLRYAVKSRASFSNFFSAINN
jgi:transcriptional regulator with XRE-family HTH domain